MPPRIIGNQEEAKARVGPRDLKDPTSRAYAVQTLYSLKRYAEAAAVDQGRIARELGRIDQCRHWEILGFGSRDEMLQSELSDVGFLNITLTAQQLAADPKVKALAEHGGVRERVGVVTLKTPNDVAVKSGVEPVSVKEQGDVGTLTVRGSNSAPYLVRRLKRDAPEVADQLARGEFKSARAAALHAGIVKQPTTLDTLSEVWAKASQNERDAFIVETGLSRVR